MRHQMLKNKKVIASPNHLTPICAKEAAFAEHGSL